MCSKGFCAVHENYRAMNASFFGSCPIFHAGKIEKIPSLCLSMLPNPTETIAMQAKGAFEIKVSL